MRFAAVVAVSLVLGGVCGYAVAAAVERYLQAPWYR